MLALCTECRTERKDHVIPVRRFFEAVFNADLRSFFAETCFQLIMTHGDNVPLFCQQHYLQGQTVCVQFLYQDTFEKTP